MLGLDLGYKTISYAPALPHLLPVLSHVSTQHKVHPNQSGLMKMVTIALNVGQF
jgi:hypothetical protein